jgi:hypothetical protein
MTTKTKIIIVVVVFIVVVVVRRLMLAKLGQGEDNVGRTDKGWKVYNLIKHGQWTSTREIKNIKEL